LGGPCEFLIPLKQLIERLENGTKIANEFAMVINHTEEGSQLSGILGARCLLDGFYLVFSW